MKVFCPGCGKEVADVQVLSRLTMTVHCPFDGQDFGVAVDPPVSADEPASPTAKETVAGA